MMEIRPRGIQDMSWFKGSVLTPAERAARAKEADPMTADLAGFLLAQLDADETELAPIRDDCDCAIEGFPFQHGVLCPAFELDRIAALRAVVTDAIDCMERAESDPTCDGFAHFTLLALAQPYRGREGWRDEWGTA